MSPTRLKICIVSVHSYPVINPKAPGLFGGMETLSWDFARGLARRSDAQVYFIVTHRSAPRRSVVDGVNVIEATDVIERYRQDISLAHQKWRQGERLPVSSFMALVGKTLGWGFLRLFYPQSRSRWSTPSHWLTDLAGDIYVSFGVNAQTEWSMLSARSMQRPSVTCLMSDFDIDQQFHDNPDYVNQYGVTSTMARKIIGQSNGLVSQTELQKRQLQEIWQRPSVLITNPLNLQVWDEELLGPLLPEAPRGPFVLWVGRADRFHKRPLEMVAAIKANPQVQFLMVLNPAEPEVLQELAAERLPNLTTIPQVKPYQMAPLMRAATIFATSSSAAFEGLPSVFMQAAASSTPIVSLETSAEWLNQSGAGVCVHGNREAFAQTIARFVRERNSPDIECHAAAGRRFVEQEHGVDHQCEKLMNYLRDVIKSAQFSENFATNDGR